MTHRQPVVAGKPQAAGRRRQFGIRVTHEKWMHAQPERQRLAAGILDVQRDDERGAVQRISLRRAECVRFAVVAIERQTHVFAIRLRDLPGGEPTVAMNRQGFVGAILRHLDTPPRHIEMTAADAVRIRQQRIAGQLVRLGIRSDVTAAPENRRERAVVTPVETGDAAAERRRDIEAQMRVGERDARELAAARLTDRNRRRTGTRKHRIGRRVESRASALRRGGNRIRNSHIWLHREAWDVAVIADGCCWAIFLHRSPLGPNCMLPIYCRFAGTGFATSTTDSRSKITARLHCCLATEAASFCAIAGAPWNTGSGKPCRPGVAMNTPPA